jgi:hypothetical protein
VSLRVAITPTGQRSVDSLRGRPRKAFDRAVERLAAEGCRAASYRLSGPIVEHICSVALYGRYRALVCFPDPKSVVVLLVGEHRRGDPDLDVYLELCRLLELPEPAEERTKPPCCEDEDEAPVDPELIDRFEAGAKSLRRASRGRRARGARRRSH